MSERNPRQTWRNPQLSNNIEVFFTRCPYQQFKSNYNYFQMIIFIISIVWISCNQGPRLVILHSRSCQPDKYIENTSWKVRVYGFYSWVVKYHKTNEWAQRTSEFYDTKRRVNKNCTKHFPWCFLFIIYISRFPWQLSRRKVLIMFTFKIVFLTVSVFITTWKQACSLTISSFNQKAKS